jgi:predicted secreted protein
MAVDAPQPAGTVAGHKLLIMRGDGGAAGAGQGGGEKFDEPVGLITKTLKFSASTTQTSVPDAANPGDNPMWVQRGIKELSSVVTGDGVCARESFNIWQQDMLAGGSRNYRIKLDDDAMGYFAGAYVLTSFELSGTYGDKVKVKLQLDNDGPVTYTPNA